MLTKPIAANADPESSHIAAERITVSGKREAHCDLVFQLVCLHPGLTACEIWSMATESQQIELGEMQRVRQRLSDMSEVRVMQGPQRKCKIRGTTQVVWFPKQSQGQLF
jgi:hypothetical protein